MEDTTTTYSPYEDSEENDCSGYDAQLPVPFARQWVSITRQEDIERRCQINYQNAQILRLKNKVEALEQDLIISNARIADLENRLFGKKSEKSGKGNSEKAGDDGGQNPKRNRGQQRGGKGHGRTDRPFLPVVDAEPLDVADELKKCPVCGLPHVRNPALDEHSDVIEIEVKAHTRRYHRPAYVPNRGCHCENNLPAVITAPPPPRLMPRSPYGVSVWTEIILGKFLYGQPVHRQLQDLENLGFPMSAGTVAGGLQTLAPLFEPVQAAFYLRQMTEEIFHNDETRWEVFVSIEGKTGTRWYLWVTRSQSVIYYNIDPSRSSAVPGAHFAGLQKDKVIIVCDRYSAYKKLARLADNIVLAFCWAHVRRDFLDAGRSFPELESWALDWREYIGCAYHQNNLRLEHWNPALELDRQSETFNQYHQQLQQTLKLMHDEATLIVAEDATEPASPLSKSAQTQQKKVYKSLLEHWSGLTIFVENPAVPMDNNLGENAIRGPVVGRKGYYGSGSIWSAMLAATLFSILQTLGLDLWGINQRHWLMAYLTACAENGGQPPEDIAPFIPWLMSEERRAELSRPYCAQAPPKDPLQTASNP